MWRLSKNHTCCIMNICKAFTGACSHTHAHTNTLKLTDENQCRMSSADEVWREKRAKIKKMNCVCELEETRLLHQTDVADVFLL